MRKAQLASVDLFIAITVFLILITATIYTWNLYNIRFNENLEYEKMELVAFQITDLLVKNPGHPTGWEENSLNVGVIGLAQDDRILSQDKITAFVNFDYNTTKEKFKIMSYDYKFRVKDLSDNVLQESGLDFTGDTSIVLERYVLLNNEKAIMEFTLWE
ncbi:MAG: hypothetical protein KKA79_04020 [Nanoarchaeota archaeon]|nr:hypothetical protein [Nanoarchaeota archaeon]